MYTGEKKHQKVKEANKRLKHGNLKMKFYRMWGVIKARNDSFNERKLVKDFEEFELKKPYRTWLCVGRPTFSGEYSINSTNESVRDVK